MTSAQPLYKIKLASGRVLGPIGLDRIRLLILKNQITGVEVAREHPHGEWVDINQIHPIADLLVAHFSGQLKADQPPPLTPTNPAYLTSGPTQVLTNGSEPSIELDGEPSEEDEKTIMADVSDEATVVMPSAEELSSPREVELQISRNLTPYSSSAPKTNSSTPYAVSDQETIVMTRALRRDVKIDQVLKNPKHLPSYVKHRVTDVKKLAVNILVGLSLSYLVFTFFFEDSDQSAKNNGALWAPIHPTLPVIGTGKADPKKSAALQTEALKAYTLDTVAGYKRAALGFQEAVHYDGQNVKALALLASTYLNLIDSSNKDEKYFEVISKLIELSRAKQLDLAETVIADVELYIMANKPEAAENRIIEFTKTHPNFDPVMFYYMALADFYRGDAQSAARYISNYPESKAFSAKYFFLRGQIAEKLGDTDSALKEYAKAIQFNPSHAKSRLAISRIFEKANHLQDAAQHLKYLTEHQGLLAPKDLARAYYLQGRLDELYKKNDQALIEMERAAALDHENHDYLLELYTLRAQAGGNVKAMQADARMYYFLGEGEKYLRDGDYTNALTQFLQARESNPSAVLPFVKIGDMFVRENNLSDARLNYKTAAQRAPNNIEIWSKYINVLIQSYEWEEATAAMDRFRKLPVPQSAIDKAAADLYEKQGRHDEAQRLYRKAMGRETIDSGVYIAYAKSLMESHFYKEAPFFFALAMRFDPLNSDALIGTAKCVAATEGIDRGISMLQDELQKGNFARAELLAAIADLETQKGSWDQAQQYVDQAIAANPEYAYPWKVQGVIFQNSEAKGAIDKALSAYQSFSERNPSDPSGHLERYRIFIKKGDFEKAFDELDRIFAMYPKYPNLHFFKGALYSMMGNHKSAIDELQIELKNNPEGLNALILLGKELVQSGAANDALTYFNKAMQVNPKSAEAKAESAYANYLLKNYAGAVALYQAALSLDPQNPTFYKRLGLAFRAQGDEASAGAAFHKYLEMEPDAPDKSEFESYR